MAALSCCPAASIAPRSSRGCEAVLRSGPAGPSNRAPPPFPTLGMRQLQGSRSALSVRATLAEPPPPSAAPLQRITDYVCRVEQSAMRQSMEVLRLGHSFGAATKFKADPTLLEQGYERCGEVTAEYAKTFYLGAHRARRLGGIVDARIGDLGLSFSRILQKKGNQGLWSFCQCRAA